MTGSSRCGEVDGQMEPAGKGGMGMEIVIEVGRR